MYEAHARRVRLVCLRLLRDPHEADDAVQQTFLSAYRSLLGGSLPRESEAWLTTIARNECRSRIRERMVTPLSDQEVDELAGRDDPAHGAAVREQLATVLAAVDGLPERERQAVVMQAFGGASNAEMARRLGTTESAVESLLFRARVQLRARVWPAVAGARALVLAPTWLRALLVPGGGTDLVAVTKMGTAVAVVGTLVALAPAVPGSHRKVAFGGPADAQAARPVPAPAPVRRAQPVRLRRAVRGTIGTGGAAATPLRVVPLLSTRQAPREHVVAVTAAVATSPPPATGTATVPSDGAVPPTAQATQQTTVDAGGTPSGGSTSSSSGGAPPAGSPPPPGDTSSPDDAPAGTGDGSSDGGTGTPPAPGDSSEPPPPPEDSGTPAPHPDETPAPTATGTVEPGVGD